MIYLVKIEFYGVHKNFNLLSENKEEVLNFAVDNAKTGLDVLGDSANFCEWCNLSGDLIDPEELLQSSNPDQLLFEIEQISDNLKCENLGYLDILEYNNIFDLLKAQEVESWCSDSLRSEIQEFKKSYNSLIYKISKEYE